MMVRFYSRAARRNLKAGATKMEENMSAAARVRREFRRGAPPKGTTPRPLVAVDKAEQLLANLRERMHAAGLKREEVDGQIIGVRSANDEPVFIPIEREKAIAILSAPDIIPLGCIFRQQDGGKNVDFFVQFTGMTERGLDVLKRAVTKTQAQIAPLRHGTN
jgi:hypothetical protein